MLRIVHIRICRSKSEAPFRLIMLHISEQEPILRASSRRRESVRAIQDWLQLGIEESRKGGYGFFSRCHAWLYVGIFIVLGYLVSTFFRPKRDAIVSELSEIYPHVPEMAVQKKIELDAYTKQEYLGKGFDLGAGNGAVGGILIRQKHVSHLHGFDAVPQAELAQENGYTDYTSANVEGVPLPDETFDFGISICVLEHVEDIGAALKEASRILKPNGTFYFSTPAPEFRKATLGYRLWSTLGLQQRADRYARYRDDHACHYHYFDKGIWVGVLQDCGYDDICAVPIFSAAQMLVYDLLNYSVHTPRIYINEHLAQILAARPRLRARMVVATESISAWAAEFQVTADNATHYFISAKKTESPDSR